MNNPLKYIDPDGRYEKNVEFLGQPIKIKISDDIKEKNPELFNKILKNIESAIAQINASSKNLSPEQKQAVTSLKGNDTC